MFFLHTRIWCYSFFFSFLLVFFYLCFFFSFLLALHLRSGIVQRQRHSHVTYIHYIFICYVIFIFRPNMLLLPLPYCYSILKLGFSNSPMSYRWWLWLILFGPAIFRFACNGVCARWCSCGLHYLCAVFLCVCSSNAFLSWHKKSKSISIWAASNMCAPNNGCEEDTRDKTGVCVCLYFIFGHDCSRTCALGFLSSFWFCSAQTTTKKKQPQNIEDTNTIEIVHRRCYCIMANMIYHSHFR